MNQQKIYQKHHHIPRFLVKHISISILFLLVLSFFSTIILQQTIAAPLDLNQDDSKGQQTAQEPKTTETDTKSSSTETETKTKVEPTQSQSSPSTPEDDSPATQDDTPTPKDSEESSDTSSKEPDASDTKSTTTTPTKKTSDDPPSTFTTDEQNSLDSTIKISNDDDTSLLSPKSIDTTSYEIKLIDKTTEKKNTDIANASSNIKTTSAYNLYLEGEIGNISKDDTITVKTSQPNQKNLSFIKEINFTASSNQNKVKLTLSEFNEKPKEVKNNLTVSPTNKIYKYVDVKLTANDTYIGETGITTMTFTFTVEKKWVEQNKLDTNTIVMMRYHNDTWATLNTTFVNESEEFLYFKAETPGLSIFAVVGDTVVEDSDAIIDESTQIPVWVSLGVIASSSTLLGVVLVKKRFIYRR